MSRNILFLNKEDIENKEITREVQKQGYHVIEVDINEQEELERLLSENFFYFVLTEYFDENTYKACRNTATKYVTYVREVQPKLINCYSFLEGPPIFNAKEKAIYHTINELFGVHKKQTEPIIELVDLNGITNEKEIIKLTDQYFSKMESERELSFQLKEELMDYFDNLLQGRTIDSWREIVLWNKRHECRKLCHCFWQFFLMQKASAIFAEEMIQYYENGELPSIVQFGSFGELSQTYFQLLLLLRRLNYDVALEEEANIVDYIMEKKISGIFIRHVIEQNQVEDKEKVYRRLEELLIKYEQ